MTLASLVAMSHGWRTDFLLVITVAWLYAAAHTETTAGKRERAPRHADTRRNAA